MFRKKTIKPYSVSVSTDFSELQPNSLPNSKVGLKKVSPDEIAASTLDPNIFTARNIIESGEYIKGDVDMTPSDPDNVERRVENGLTNYINNNPVDNSTNN